MDDIDRMVGRVARGLANMVTNEGVRRGSVLEEILGVSSEAGASSLMHYACGLLEVSPEVADLVLERMGGVVDFCGDVVGEVEPL